MNISFIGLGKLGLCSAACFAAKGHKVIGVDSNAEHLAMLQKRQTPISETGIGSLLEKAWDNMAFTADYAEAVRQSEATMIIVPTPSLDNGKFTNEHMVAALESLAPALAQKSGFHIVDIVSTVMPGSCEGVFIPLLEKLTGKRCGVDFGLAYNPEFIALGSVIKNFLNPDLVLIGASDERSANALCAAYASTVESEPFYGVMSLINAEITKLALNCFVTMKISFANELALLCDNIPGADVDVVSRAIGSDSRVGGKYLGGGLGFGGPCFPRDNRAMQAAGAEAGYKPQISSGVMAVNGFMPQYIAGVIEKHARPGQSVCLFGMSYKQDTHIVEESQSVMLARLLADAGYEVRLHDPQAMEEAKKALGEAAAAYSSPYAAAAGAGAIVLLANWPQFAEYDWDKLEQEAAPGALLFDTWRILKNRAFKKIQYYPFGGKRK